MKKYYIIHNDKKEGPFSLRQLKEESINPSTLIWHNGLPDWTEARHLKEIVNSLEMEPPPLPNKGKQDVGRIVKEVIKNANVNKKQIKKAGKVALKKFIKGLAILFLSALIGVWFMSKSELGLGGWLPTVISLVLFLLWFMAFRYDTSSPVKQKEKISEENNTRKKQDYFNPYHNAYNPQSLKSSFNKNKDYKSSLTFREKKLKTSNERNERLQYQEKLRKIAKEAEEEYVRQKQEKKEKVNIELAYVVEGEDGVRFYVDSKNDIINKLDVLIAEVSKEFKTKYPNPNKLEKSHFQDEARRIWQVQNGLADKTEVAHIEEYVQQKQEKKEKVNIELAYVVEGEDGVRFYVDSKNDIINKLDVLIAEVPKEFKTKYPNPNKLEKSHFQEAERRIWRVRSGLK